jgi:formylglycine-generating enzyme required for sulfatase activity
VAAAQKSRGIAFVVGAALTAPVTRGGPGVPGVEGVVQLIRKVYEGSPEMQAKFDTALANSNNTYQTAFSHLIDFRGVDEANAVIRSAVLHARTDLDKLVLADVTPELCERFEKDTTGWHLTPAVAALGGIVASVSPSPVVLTSNFDPLIEVSIRTAGVSPVSTALHGDGGLGATRAEGVEVVHFHGHWVRTDTLHTPTQLLQPRPKLRASLKRLLDRRLTVVIGYGGWDDVFTQNLAQVVAGDDHQIDLIWTFYGDGPDAIIQKNARLLEGLRDAIDRHRIQLCKGVDIHKFFPQLADRLGKQAVKPGPGSGGSPPSPLIPPPAAPSSSGSSSGGSLARHSTSSSTARSRLWLAVPGGLLLALAIGVIRSSPDQRLKTRPQEKWIHIKGGQFVMGSESGDLDENPPHPVTLPSFDMWKTEVTVAEYEQCVEAADCSPPVLQSPECNYGKPERKNHPVNCVTWAQARAFARWLKGRLPTESEWEYAARSRGNDWLYPNGPALPSCDLVASSGVTGECHYSGTVPVGLMPDANTLQGLSDMAGNVWEWVEDAWLEDYRHAPRDGTAVTGEMGALRVARGGGWNSSVAHARTTNRGRFPSDRVYPFIGFRICRKPPS